MTLDEAKKLAVKILSKTLDATKLTADKGIIYWKCTKYLLTLNSYIKPLCIFKVGQNLRILSHSKQIQ